MSGASECIAAYISAKDGNRPWLVGQAFAEDASLTIEVRTAAIDFPENETGVDGIAETLVRRFSREQENVYTFCLASSPTSCMQEFNCDWLVGMSGRNNGDIRVGCGRYHWLFVYQPKARVSELRITIEVMQILVRENLPAIMGWLSALPYPWCSAQMARQNMPELTELEPISDYLGRIA